MFINIFGLPLVFMLVYLPILLVGESADLASDTKTVLYTSQGAQSAKAKHTRRLLVIRTIGLTTAILMYFLLVLVVLRFVL